MKSDDPLALHYRVMNENAATSEGVAVGEGGNWVLLLHGLFGSGDNLGALAKALAADFRVVLVDLRNHGRSPHSAVTDLPALAADIVALQDALGIAASALVGHSLGGKVAMQIALSAPARVSRLVVADIAPIVYAAHHQAIFAALAALDLSQLQTRSDADTQMAQWIPDSAVRQFLLKSLVRTDEGFQWRFNWPVLRDRYADLLAAPQGMPYQGPTLFIKGELSDYIDAAATPAMRSLFPHFQFKMIAGAGHWLHGEKPAAFNRLVQNFLLEK